MIRDTNPAKIKGWNITLENDGRNVRITASAWGTKPGVGHSRSETVEVCTVCISGPIDLGRAMHSLAEAVVEANHKVEEAQREYVEWSAKIAKTKVGQG
jgi:hypothetical protein